VRWVHTVIAYVYALKHHLRNQPLHAAKKISLSTDALDRAITAPDDNPPLAVLQELGDLLLEARLRRFIDPLHVPAIDASISAMTDVQGACERIKSTPIPFSYTVLMHRIVAAYCGLLPFGVAEAIGWATPVVVLFVSYALFGLDAIGEEIEQPFGLDTNDLPLSAVTRTIEINLRARLGEVTLPPPKKAKRGVLR
jgi:putative membrane protein